MRELLSTTQSNSFSNHFASSNGSSSMNNNATNGNNQRRYAVVSTEWISAIGEELGMHPLPDSLLKRLAEDASYRLREVLHKCVTRLNHSRRKKLTAPDVNAVLTNLCDADPVIGLSNQMPSYHAEAQVYVPHEDLLDLSEKALEPVNLSQSTGPHLSETELIDPKLTELRHNYAKKALKTLYNGSQKTFQVLLNDCTINPQLDGEGVINILMAIARTTVISNNAQNTRVTMRTCQLIIALASNSEAVYPYHSNSVEKLTELLLELLLGQSFINSHVESLFRTCALKLMLRWPSVAEKFTPMLEAVMWKQEQETAATTKKRIVALELLAGVQPLIFFQQELGSPLALENVLKSAMQGTVLWQQLALSTCAFGKSKQQRLNLQALSEHFGDAILPYIKIHEVESKENIVRKPVALPIIVRSKIKYVKVRTSSNKFLERQNAFPDSVLRGPRSEIRFAFAGGRPVAQNNLRRVSLRASYQILRSDMRATTAHVAAHRLLILKDKKRYFNGSYNLTNFNL